MRTHLLKMHREAAAHHELLQGLHKELADHHRRAQDAEGMAPEHQHDKLAATHEEIAKAHQTYADLHKEMATELEGEADGHDELHTDLRDVLRAELGEFEKRFLGTVRPTRARAVIPTDSEDPAVERSTLVPRPGMRDPRLPTDPAEAVPELEHFFK